MQSKMTRRFSKLGLVFVGIFAAAIGLAVIAIPFSFGFSILFIPFLSRPWNELISFHLVVLPDADMDVFAVLPGLLINASILYLVGYLIERFVQRRQTDLREQ